MFEDSLRLTSTSLEFLLSFMNKYELQEDMAPVAAAAGSKVASRREKLLQWVFAYAHQVCVSYTLIEHMPTCIMVLSFLSFPFLSFFFFSEFCELDEISRPG